VHKFDNGTSPLNDNKKYNLSHKITFLIPIFLTLELQFSFVVSEGIPQNDKSRFGLKNSYSNGFCC
jgi:hypothetical protein